MGPLPVTRLHGSVCFTDGHTRAFLAWKRGVGAITATWDDAGLDIQTYLVCLAWCDEAGIRTVADLAGHVVDDDIYKREWIARCEAIGAGEKDT